MSRKSQNLDRQPLKTKKKVFDPQNRMLQRRTSLLFENSVGKLTFSNGFRNFARRQTRKTHARIVVPENQKSDPSISKTKTQSGALTKEKHTGSTFLNAKSSVSTIRKSGPQACQNSGYSISKIKTRSVVPNIQNP